ncbi:MAG: hypothetical protein OXE94_03285 [Aestuariivita sp.]|nr:hypothetical protein [Aestuariivita sp.]
MANFGLNPRKSLKLSRNRCSSVALVASGKGIFTHERRERALLVPGFPPPASFAWFWLDG